MRKLVVNLTIVIIVIHSVNGIQTAESLHEDEQSLKVDENVNSVKTKRGAYGYTSGLGLSLPAYGQGYTKYSPYARYPGIYKKAIGQSAYTITPGSAVTHSFNVNYPKVFVSNPVLRPTSILIHSKQIVPVAPISVYANSFPVLVRKPIVVQKPIVPIAPVPQFIPVIPPNIHVVNPIGVPSVLSQSTIIPHDEWRPIISSVHNSGHTAHINQPAVTVLPPLRPLHSTASTHIPNNYYLPPDNLPIHHDIGPHGVSLGEYLKEILYI